MQKEPSTLLGSQPQEDPTKNSNPTKTTKVQYPTPRSLPLSFPHKQIILDENEFNKSLLIHLKTSKSAKYITCYDNQSHKPSRKLFKFQGDKLTKLRSILYARKSLENECILSTIQHFSSLSSLNLRFEGLYGEPKFHQEALFKTLASLKNLCHLNISFQDLTFQDPKMLQKLMKALGKSTKISSLSLRLSNCEGLASLHYRALFSNMAKLTQLRALKLNFENSGESLSDSNIAYILPKLPLLTQLELIFDSLRSVEKRAFQRLFRAFQFMKNLSDLTLNLPRSELRIFSSNDDKSILESLKYLAGTSIQRLSLSLFRDFSNRNLCELSETLKELTLLKSLSLNIDWDFYIFHEPLADFCSTLASINSLTSLNLAFPSKAADKNNIKSLSSALVLLQNLVSFKLEFKPSEEIQDSNLQILFMNLKALKSLRYLDIKIIDQNQLKDNSLIVLGESLKELNLLRNLSLNFSQAPLLTSKGIEAICSAIQLGHPNLFHLSLVFETNQNIDTKAIQKLAETLKSLVYLYSIELGFDECLNIGELGELFSVLRQMGNIQEVGLSTPFSETNCIEISRLEKIKDALACLSE